MDQNTMFWMGMSGLLAFLCTPFIWVKYGLKRFKPQQGMVYTGLTYWCPPLPYMALLVSVVCTCVCVHLYLHPACHHPWIGNIACAGAVLGVGLFDCFYTRDTGDSGPSPGTLKS